MLRQLNADFDRLTETIRQARPKGHKALCKALGRAFEEERVEAEKHKRGSWRMYVLEHGGRLCRGGLASAIVSDIVIRSVDGAKILVKQEDMAIVSRQIERLAVALACFHADTGRWPIKLAELCPSLVASVPLDIFTGKPLIYKPRKDGYLLYSVGPNLKDEGGEFNTQAPNGPPRRENRRHRRESGDARTGPGRDATERFRGRDKAGPGRQRLICPTSAARRR